ncbi:MAG TPA: PQQ-binding-like beta-propeller repeat protein [Vicinamibacteria bacterium]|nr:PQQ-binding-like beta-propeller repeat protein [Vicinamibacteria bacterium]
MILRYAKLATFATLAVSMAPASHSQDWPQWRGPNRDGAVTSFSEPSTWPESLSERWKAEVGLGYATPVLVGNRIYTYTRQNEDEVMMALDADTGEVLWRTSYPAPFQMNPATARHGAGPKSTPTFAENRLFTLGMSGLVTAFDAGTGKQLWQNAAPPVQPLYHTAMSPVVDDNLVIVHIGGHDDGALTAFDAATGDVQWSWDGDGPAYGSPIVIELEGTRQVVTFTQENLVGIAVTTGELLWRRPFTTQSTTTSQTPILYKDTLIEAGRGNGITAFKLRREADAWRTENVWHTDEVSLHMTNGVVVDGMLFGLSHLNSGQYFGLDLDSGRVLWVSDPRQAENAAIVRAGDLIFSLEDDAELVVVRNSRAGFEPVKRYEVAQSATWAQPTISGKRLFVKDVSTLALLALE